MGAGYKRPHWCGAGAVAVRSSTLVDAGSGFSCHEKLRRKSSGACVRGCYSNPAGQSTSYECESRGSFLYYTLSCPSRSRCIPLDMRDDSKLLFFFRLDSAGSCWNCHYLAERVYMPCTSTSVHTFASLVPEGVIRCITHMHGRAPAEAHATKLVCSRTSSVAWHDFSRNIGGQGLMIH